MVIKKKMKAEENKAENRWTVTDEPPNYIAVREGLDKSRFKIIRPLREIYLPYKLSLLRFRSVFSL